jgi:hypothetical protein
MPHLNLYAKINDHGNRQGNTGQIRTQGWCPMASRVALDLPYWAMHSTLYRLICMALAMTSKGGALFAIVNCLSCITVAKGPCYG